MLGVPGLFSAAYGNVGSSIYYALGVTALYALGLTPLVFIISGIFFLCTALSYAEGTTAMPVAGGSTAFARRAFNDIASFVAGWAQVLNYLVTIAISAFAVPNYLSTFWPLLGTWPANTVFGIAVVVGLATLNVIGLRESSQVNMAVALVDLSTQMLVVGLGLVLLLSPETLTENVRWGEAPTWSQFLLGISISMIAYTGIETISNLSEETRNPSKNVPRSVLLTFGTVVLIFSLLPMVALSALPVEEGPDGKFTTELAEEFIDQPVLGVVQQFESLPDALRTGLETWVGILAATILTIAANAGMLGLSRLAYSMGRHRQLPSFVSRLEPRRRTPATAIALAGVFSVLLLLPGRVTELANLYSFGAMLSFTIAHVSIIALRYREPDMERPFRVPLNVRIRGRPVPLPSVIGGAATFTTWLVVVANQELARIVGFSWMLGGLLVFLLYRRLAAERGTAPSAGPPPGEPSP